MTNQERLLIEALFDRLERAVTPQDPETQAFIGDRIKSRPDAVYRLAQTVLIQNQELAAAEARIVNLQARLEGSDPTEEGEGAARYDILRSITGIEKPDATGFLASAAAVTLTVARA